MNRARLRNSLLIGLVSFLLGWVVTRPIFVAWKDSQVILPGSPTQAAVASPAETVNYAIVWIDDWNKPVPLVEAIWIAHLEPGYQAVELIGLPAEVLPAPFSRETKSVPTSELSRFADGAFGGTLTFDRKDIRVLIDDVGGIYLDGHLISGTQAEEYLSSQSEGGTDRIIRQAAVIQGLLVQVAAGGSEIRLGDLIDIPKSTAEHATLVETVSHYYPLRLNTVSFRTIKP